MSKEKDYEIKNKRLNITTVFKDNDNEESSSEKSIGREKINNDTKKVIMIDEDIKKSEKKR